MQLTFEKARWSIDGDGFWLSLKVLDRARAQRFVAEMKPKRYVAELKEYRERRSLDANAYAWHLLGKLAEETGIPKNEIYRSLIREIGGNYDTVCVRKEAAEELCRRWGFGRLGWIAERFPSKLAGCENVNLYYGSSVYDTRQMSRLIDLIVQECRQQGIETATPEEQARMLEEHG